MILSNGDLVSDLPHPRVTLKRPNSPDIPYPTPGQIHTRTANNERNYQELKRREKERERHAHTTNSETERKRERQRKKAHVTPECRNKLWTQFTVRQNSFGYHTHLR